MIRNMVVLAVCTLAASEPDSIKPAYDERAILRAHGVGDQIYSCQSKDAGYAWVLKAPEALLFSSDGKVVGHHFAGPTWQWNDKSQVTGKMLASAPSPDAASIAWLRVEVVQHQGSGALGDVQTIQRLNTKGGKAPATGCDAGHIGATIRVPYEADYVFFAKCRGKC